MPRLLCCVGEIGGLRMGHDVSAPHSFGGVRRVLHFVMGRADGGLPADGEGAGGGFPIASREAYVRDHVDCGSLVLDRRHLCRSFFLAGVEGGAMVAGSLRLSLRGKHRIDVSVVCARAWAVGGWEE